MAGLDVPAASPLRHRRVQSILLFLIVFVAATVWVLRMRGGIEAVVSTSTDLGQPGSSLLSVSTSEKNKKQSEFEANAFKNVVGDAVDKAFERHLDALKAMDSPKKAAYRPPNKNIAKEELEATIDQMHARFLDFLNGEEGLDEASSMNGVFGGSLLDQATPFNVRTTWNRVHQYALHLAKDPTYEKTDFLQLGRRVRAHRIAYVILHDKPSLITLLSLATSDHDEPASAVHDALLIELENIETILAKHLYGWIMPRYPSVAALQKEFSTATGNKDLELGIVLTTGQWHFELAAHAIITLRDVLKCDLPIEIQYAGPNDLTPDMHKAFNAMPGVRTVDVLDRFDSSVGVAGWAIKPFAILASRFRTVIFMDADALLFQNPENLVRTSTLFKQYGTLFYHDRTVKNGGNLNWFKGINPTYTRYASSLRYMDDRSHNEMESGVVVVDKGRTGNLVGMLMTCVLNSRVERDGMTYKHMHGDKESFWMSWDIARVPFKFTPAFGGAVGYKNEKGNVCGGLFHTDEYLKPLWWNGGVIKNKHHDRDGNLMEFEYAAFDTVGKDIEWEWETPKSPFCLGPKHREFEIVELTAKEKSDGAEFVRIFKEMKAAGWKEYFTQKYNVKW